MIIKKEILFIILISLLAIELSCSGRHEVNQKNDELSDRNEFPEIKFDTTFHDFGTLVQGEQVSFTFKFINTGNSNLVILDAYATCGCTVPYYSKEHIAKGDEGKIEIVFDSAGKNGVQYKTVTIKTNTKISEKTLSLRANVTENNYKF